MKMKYFSYILIADSKDSQELDAYFNMNFSDLNYEVLSTISATDMLDMYGEIYDAELLKSEQAYKIRFYVTQQEVDSIEEKLSNKPTFFSVEKSELDFEVEKFLNPVEELIHLTEHCIVTQKNDNLEKLPNKTYIVLPSKNAFGTGYHDTTKLAATFIEKYVSKESKVLDIGCGTGILAVLAAKKGASHVLALDSDPVAISEAKDVMKDNSVAAVVNVQENNLLENLNIDSFSIIVANLSYQIYLKLFPDLFEKLLENQVCIFSGIMKKEKELFESLLLSYHGSVLEVMETDMWCAFAVTRKKKKS